MSNHRTLHIASENGKDYTGYLALPPKGKGPGLLLLQEIYGLHPDIKGLADYFAAAGYVVLAPDVFFWRKQPNLVFDYAQRESARDALVEIGGENQVSADVPAALEALRKVPEVQGGKVGILGFGYGGILSFKAVTAGDISVDFGIAYFPARLALDKAAAVSQPWLFHFPELDAVAEPQLYQRTVEAFKDRPNVEIHFYPKAGHGFAIAGRPEFDAADTDKAHARTRQFLESVTALV